MAKKTTVKKEKEAISGNAGASGRRRVTFKVTAAVGSKVYLAGSFNDWSVEECPMKDKGGNGEFTCMKFLAPGYYEYKFVIDGIWDIDASNPCFVANDMGTLNSVLEVK